MSKFNEFFEQLASDAKLMEAYKQDPKGVMKSYGLTDEEILAVMSGDQEKIKTLSGDESIYGNYVHIQTPSK
ncbi:hypothetical protein L2750_11940 [Shewanella submarina]|uniref:Extradiol ring-cleavage dioxygenase LigAB LigA subunit domain-containing protein n=1 Tax=Shewanella submarina TaxID=2016376 RepID=A0ABV7GE67_9GAMM|nr:hypothetical protein [Shewanella submarina]MCL1037863.1 hypothetical protein [Shewanella submarina]